MVGRIQVVVAASSISRHILVVKSHFRCSRLISSTWLLQRDNGHCIPSYFGIVEKITKAITILADGLDNNSF